MRSGAWSLVIGLGLTLPVAGCSGGYPLPPTRCDEWCHTTKGAVGGSCPDYYNPSSCVASCEQAEIDSEACRAEFDAVLGCYRGSPNVLKQHCYYDTVPKDCDSEEQRLLTCAGQYFGNGG